MPAVSGHNSRVLVFPQNVDQYQGDEDISGTIPVALMANKWQLSYKTELLETTSYENPRAPLITPLSSRVAGLTDIDFNFEAYWDTNYAYSNPFGFPDLRPGGRPSIALEIKKNLNLANAAPTSTNPAEGGVTTGATQQAGKIGVTNPVAQYFYFVALITECQVSTEVKGVVTYTVSGKATPYIADSSLVANGFTYFMRTGMQLPGQGLGGLPFSSQDQFYQDVADPHLY